MIERREFIAGLGSAAAWPMVVRTQQPDRVRRIGVLLGYDESHPEGRLVSPDSRRDLRSWVGLRTAMCAWRFVSPPTMLI
jgi:hypothetical protein